MVLLAVKLATLPDCCAVGKTGTLSTRAGEPVTTHVKLPVAVFTPSLAATATA